MFFVNEFGIGSLIVISGCPTFKIVLPRIFPANKFSDNLFTKTKYAISIAKNEIVTNYRKGEQLYMGRNRKFVCLEYVNYII